MFTFLLFVLLWVAFGIMLAMIKLHNGLLGDCEGEFTDQQYTTRERFYFHVFLGPVIVIRDITVFPAIRAVIRLNKFLDNYGKTTE
jgi:hypothetical protein